MRLMDNPFDFFDKIFYINLDSRTDRRKLMEEQFQRFGIKAERFPAVSLTKEDNDDLVARGCKFYDDERPEYAPRIKSCTLSHLTILFRAKIMNYKNILIFEDDAVIDEGVFENLSKCIIDLEKVDWGIFYLGCNPLEYFKETEYLGRVKRATTTHCLALNSSFYDEILNNVSFFRYYPCIDGYYGNLGFNKEGKIYMSLKNLVYQRSDFSDIEGHEVDYKLLIDSHYEENIIDKPEGW
jgi:GR25 family glycosyltransferase involved in LPS biosynthesis